MMTTHNSQPTLAELIITQKGDRTYRKLSKDCGGMPTDSRLNSLVNVGIKNFPDIDTIQRLAIGLRVNVTDVLLACARSLGLNVGAGDPGSLSIPGAGYLPDSAKELLADTASEMLKLQQSSEVKKEFTEYQAQLRQDFTHGARLRRVPAMEIEAALQGPGWYLVDADSDATTTVDASLGWITGDHARQLKAALRDVLTESTQSKRGDRKATA